MPTRLLAVMAEHAWREAWLGVQIALFTVPVPGAGSKKGIE
jgi:hypothetical protein